MNYLIFALISFIFSVIFVKLSGFIAQKYEIVDVPDNIRKKHSRTTPLLGGFGIFLTFFIVLFLARDYILIGELNARHWLGVFFGACFLMIGGVLDDKYNLSPKTQIIFSILAIISVLFGGVNIEKITNPFGGDFLYLSSFVSAFFIFLWLSLMMYSTKILDGLDGLVGGVSAIGAFIIFLFTITTKYHQPDLAMVAIILCAAILGFLVFNWNPARIFLGEGGSLLLGYLIGILAIISGGKVAIALLIMGLPLLDLFWTIIRRYIAGKNPFRSADRGHLHFKLIDAGLNIRQAVLVFYFFAAFFGLSALWLQSMGKVLMLVVLVLLMIMMTGLLSFYQKKF